MAIIQGMCSSFKEELLKAIHDLPNDTLKLALFESSATLTKSTTAYAASNESSGTGYTAGGATVANVTVTLSGDVAFINFDDVTWNNVTLSTRGALLYNSSKSNRAIAVFDFGENKTLSNGDITIQLPLDNAANAILRIS